MANQYLFDLESLPAREPPRRRPHRRRQSALTPGTQLALAQLQETLARVPKTEMEARKRRWIELERNLAIRRAQLERQAQGKSRRKAPQI